ncbi:MAG TPA: hypothetical protein VG034_13880 [Acidimicrobiia bacterium]|nr:hypothetical protein [Acidimicrobiia bacterium]
MIGAAMVAAGVAAMPLPGSASAELSGFRAVAVAEGERVTFSVPGFAVVEDIIDGGGPMSQAAVDGQGASSFASLPYPGDTALAFPGLFAAVAGQPLPAGYPFFVSASHPTTPDQQLKDPSGAYELAAQAAAGTANGTAQLRGHGGDGQNSGSGGTQATSSVLVEGDTVKVVAETVNEALNIGGGALRIASVRSRSVSAYQAGEENPTTTTELAVEGASAGDTKFSFGPNGLVVAGTAVPIPAGTGIEQLNQALAPAGVSIRFVEPQKLVGGASAGTLEIAVSQKSPASGVPGGTIRVRLGGATSAITLGAALPVDPGVTAGIGDDAGTSPAGPSEAAGQAATPLTAGLDSSPSAASAVPGSALDTSSPSTASVGAGFATPTAAGVAAPDPTAGLAAAGTESAAPVPRAASTTMFQPRHIGADGFVFGSVIVAGLLMMILSSLWRAKGVLH